MVVDLLKGTRLQGPVVVMAAAGIGFAVPIFQVSNYAAQVGTRTFRLKRIKGLNGAGADTIIHIGTGVGGTFLDAIPPLLTINGMNFDFVEDDLPEVEWSADMTCYPVAATVTIQVEVVEIG